MADRWSVKFWKLYEPTHHVEVFTDRMEADQFVSVKQAEGFLCIIRVEESPVEETLPRKMIRLLLDNMKEKFDG